MNRGARGDSLLMLSLLRLSNRKPPLLSESESGGSKSQKVRIVVSTAVAAALICGCAAAGTGTAETAQAPREEEREAAGEADRGTILPDRIEIITDSDYPYNAEEIMYLSGVRATAYQQNTRYSLCDLDGDDLSELLIEVTDDNPYGWLPEEDYKAFMERADRIAAYFRTIKSFPYAACDGEMVWGEAAADIGGMAIGLKIAKKYQDFDYDLYFRSHAELWRMQSTINTERYDISNEHPLRYLRINTVVQQFEEFLDTYGIQEGDLMYMKPEDRINLWT